MTASATTVHTARPEGRSETSSAVAVGVGDDGESCSAGSLRRAGRRTATTSRPATSPSSSGPARLPVGADRAPYRRDRLPPIAIPSTRMSAWTSVAPERSERNEPSSQKPPTRAPRRARAAGDDRFGEGRARRRTRAHHFGDGRRRRAPGSSSGSAEAVPRTVPSRGDDGEDVERPTRLGREARRRGGIGEHPLEPRSRGPQQRRARGRPPSLAARGRAPGAAAWAARSSAAARSRTSSSTPPRRSSTTVMSGKASTARNAIGETRAERHRPPSWCRSGRRRECLFRPP